MLGDPTKQENPALDKLWGKLSSRAVFFEIKKLVQDVESLLENKREFSLSIFLTAIVQELYDGLKRGHTPFVWWTQQRRMNQKLGSIKPLPPRQNNGRDNAWVPFSRQAQGGIEEAVDTTSLTPTQVSEPPVEVVDDYVFEVVSGKVLQKDNFNKLFLGDGRAYQFMDILAVRTYLCKIPDYIKKHQDPQAHCPFRKDGSKYIQDVLEMPLVDNYRLSWLLKNKQGAVDYSKRINRDLLKGFFCGQGSKKQTSNRLLGELKGKISKKQWEEIHTPAITCIWEIYNSFAEQVMRNEYHGLDQVQRELTSKLFDTHPEQSSFVGQDDQVEGWKGAVGLYWKGIITVEFVRKLFQIRKRYVALAKDYMKHSDNQGDPSKREEAKGQLVELLETYHVFHGNHKEMQKDDYNKLVDDNIYQQGNEGIKPKRKRED